MMSMCMKAFRSMYQVAFKKKSLVPIPKNLFQQNSRHFRCNTKLCIKMYMEYENQHAFKVMKNKGYVKNIKISTSYDELNKEQFEEIMQQDWSRMSHGDLFKVFSTLGKYSSANGLCISNKIFDSYIDSLTDSIKQASDKELISIFYSILKWPETESVRTRNYIEVWVALDEECLKRLRGWSYDEALSFVAMFYMLNVARISDFPLKCMQKLASKSKQLTNGQLVQAMFYIGILRRSPFDVHNLEVKFLNNFSEFSIDEIAIMSMGFFKSKTPIRSPELMVRIVNEVINQSKNIHEISLAALLKIIRYSLKMDPNKVVFQLLDSLESEVPRLSPMCNVHLALVATTTLTFHEKCLVNVVDYTIPIISTIRIKDLERLVLTFGTFNFIPNTKESFIEKVLDELRKPERNSEIEKFGRSFASCVSYLGYLGIYPVDLMKKILSNEFLLKTYGKDSYMYGREILTLNYTAQLFCPNSEINYLSDKTAISLAKKYTDFVPSEDYSKQYNVTEKMMLDVMKILKESRGGEDYVIGTHVVSHHQRGDILICNDQHGSPLKVKDHFSMCQFGLMHEPPDDNKWVALVIAGRNAIIHNSGAPTGPFHAKIRELRTLGYNAVLVPWSKYSSLDNNEAKTEYLNSLINEALQKNIKKI